MQKIYVDTDRDRLDLKFIHDFISNSYWGKGRTMGEIERTVEFSLNFGIYLEEEQVGYARVVTDYTIFAYLMDVFIAPKSRGKGYSKFLIREILHHHQLKEVRTWKLATLDARGLYEKFGFKIIEDPAIMMELKRRN